MYAILPAAVLSVIVYYLLYKTLFDDLEDFLIQLKSLVAWLPITALLAYDFSQASCRMYIWFPSGAFLGAFLYLLLH